MEVLNASMLLDFYGQLLTQRTRLILELHFDEDMSMAEIAQQEGISRQAVHDTIQRGRRSLEDYEAKLKLLERFNGQKKSIALALEALDRDDKAQAQVLLADLIQLL